MLNPKPHSRFKKDFKKYQHKQAVIDELDKVIVSFDLKKNYLKNTKIMPFLETMSAFENVMSDPMFCWFMISMKSFYI